MGKIPPNTRHPGDTVQRMQTESERASFERHLRAALISLYNPSVLRGSPLAEVFGVDQRGDLVSALRRTLIDAIESLRPNESTPLGSKTWRVYQVLRRRYTEQLTQREVASDLGLSIRQLQREERLAREVLADYLWTVHNLDAKVLLTSASTRAGDQTPPGETRVLTRAQELEWLRSSVPAQMIDITEEIQGVLEILGPLSESSGVSVEYVERAAQADLPHLYLQEPMLRQALLHVVSTAIRCVPGGRVRIQAEALPQQVHVHIHATTRGNAPPRQLQEFAESLEMAQQLIQPSRGSLETIPTGTEGGGFTARIALPVAEQVTVLAIDDNADTLLLFQRYLSGRRYRFIGTQDPQRGLELAEEVRPQVIVLDVMMPGRDGWTLLGQLREHPKIGGTPIVVCTILPGEQLALTLGAAGFIRKPVSRAEFLAALEHLLDQSLKGPE